jgi:hypothetical protein
MKTVDLIYGESQLAHQTAANYRAQIAQAQGAAPFANGSNLSAATIDGNESRPYLQCSLKRSNAFPNVLGSPQQIGRSTPRPVSIHFVCLRLFSWAALSTRHRSSGRRIIHVRGDVDSRLRRPSCPGKRQRGIYERSYAACLSLWVQSTFGAKPKPSKSRSFSGLIWLRSHGEFEACLRRGSQMVADGSRW